MATAGGFLVQSLPPQDDAEVDLLMARIAQLPRLSELLAGGATPEDILERLFAGMPYDTLEKRALAFQCSCTRGKVERALISMGHEELQLLMEEQGEVSVACEFCRESYLFGRDELERLLESM